MPRTLAVVWAFALLFAACGSKLPAGKRYAMEGTVMALDPKAHSATIAAGQIGDWMMPMTMEYPVQPDSELQKLHAGDKIQATVVVVDDSRFYVTDVKVVGSAATPTVPAQ